MNKVILQGRLTKDPEIKYTQSANSTMIVNFNLAVNRRYKREGEPDVDFIPVISFGKIAEIIEKYVKKANQIVIVGRIQVRSYDDNSQRKWITNVVAEEVYFCGNNKNNDSSNREVPPEVSGDGFIPIDESTDDELPF